MSGRAAGGAPGFSLFTANGVELEYMIIDRRTLKVRPVADRVLSAATGGFAGDYEEGAVGWSNELTLHLIELKMGQPAPSLRGWAGLFSADVRRINDILKGMDAMLLPGGMHPTMDPTVEARLWPHDGGEIYAAYDRIFNCRQHGFANLQSCHLNLPFKGDREFHRLHSAIRVVLPLLPALAASSPVMEGKVTGILDNRLHVYCTHQARVPSAMGQVVPEPITSRDEYQKRILAPIYKEIAPLDRDGLLRREFLNARGAIARFERDAVEIRLLDMQEAPLADLAVCLLVRSTVRALAEERWAKIKELDAISTEDLAELLSRVLESAERTMIADSPLVAAFGLRGMVVAGDVWRHLARVLRDDSPEWNELGGPVDVILRQGPLARRLLRALGDAPSPERLRHVYGELATCLAEARLFLA